MWFCKRAADVVVKFFITFFIAKEYDRQTFYWINSMKFRVSLLAKHGTYQTLHECINAAVVILPIEKYKLMLKSSFNIQHAYAVDVKFFVIFFAVREWNDRLTVDESNAIKSKTTFVCEHTTYLTLTKRVNTYLWYEKLNSLRGPFILVIVISKFFAKCFHCHKFQRPSN